MSSSHWRYWNGPGAQEKSKNPFLCWRCHETWTGKFFCTGCGKCENVACVNCADCDQDLDALFGTPPCLEVPPKGAAFNP